MTATDFILAQFRRQQQLRALLAASGDVEEDKMAREQQRVGEWGGCMVDENTAVPRGLYADMLQLVADRERGDRELAVVRSKRPRSDSPSVVPARIVQRRACA